MIAGKSFGILVEAEGEGVLKIADIAVIARGPKTQTPPPRAAVPHDPSENHANLG
jgi:hypothetical protein